MYEDHAMKTKKQRKKRKETSVVVISIHGKICLQETDFFLCKYKECVCVCVCVWKGGGGISASFVPTSFKGHFHREKKVAHRVTPLNPINPTITFNFLFLAVPASELA